jgi:hypothetical protein
MFVRLELVTYGQDGTRAYRRQLTVKRRNTWLPPQRFRETTIHTVDILGWRDYRLDRKASAERGVIVYSQIAPQAPSTGTS